MRFRRIVSLFLAVILCIISGEVDSFHTYAEEETKNRIMYISAFVNGNPKWLPAIQNESGVLLFSGKTLSEITVYQNEENAMLFQHDKATDSTKYREILIDNELKQANIVNFWSNQPIIKKTVKLPDIINYNDEWYFPLAEMLPLLNSHAVVEENHLYIEDVKYSMSNIMPEFKIEDYMYNTYNENDLLITSSEKVLTSYSYLYNTVLNFDLKRLSFVGRYVGKVDSYEEILTAYLAEDQTYYEALKDEKDYALPLIDYIQGDDSERISVLVDAMGPAKEIADSYFENGEMTVNDYGAITSLSKVTQFSDFAIDLYSIAAIYTDHVDDHYQMLKSVYNIGDTENTSFFESIADPSAAAANRVYATYSKDKVNMIAGVVCQQIEKALTGELQDIVLQQVAEKKGLGNGFLWSQLATCVAKSYFIATDFYVQTVASECENLGYFNKMMEEGYSQYSKYTDEYDSISYENIENIRLSSIFTLLSSRSIYQALCNSDKAIGNSGEIYQRRIDAINEILKKFYLAKNCCRTDSEEYIEERVNALNKSIANVETSHKVEDNYFELYKSYFIKNYSLDDLVCLADVTHDGIDDMIVITDGDYRGSIKFSGTIKGIVYTINNKQIIKIHEKNGSASHAGGFFEWYLTPDGNLAEGIHSMWQGMGEQHFVEYNLTNNGERVEIERVTLSSDTSPINENGSVTDEAYQNYVDQINIKVERFFLLYSSCSEATVSPQNINLDPRIVFNIEEIKNEVNKIVDYYGAKGIVSTESTALNLRKTGDTDSEIITKIPKNATVTILESTVLLSTCPKGKWYLVDYEGQIGYVSSDYVKLTEEKVQLTEEQIIAIAQLKYYEGLHALEWHMSSCFEYNQDIEFSKSEYVYTLLSNTHTKDDWMNHVHALFSYKYDDYYKYDEIININSENNYPIYLEKDNNWYASDLIHRKGALNVNVLYPDKHRIIELSIASINENEITFQGTINWIDAQDGYIYSDSPKQDISGFSIVYEDGRWKCGKLIT